MFLFTELNAEWLKISLAFLVLSTSKVSSSGMCIQQAEGLIGPFDFQGEGRGRKGNTRQGGEV